MEKKYKQDTSLMKLIEMIRSHKIFVKSKTNDFYGIGL